MKRLEKGNVGLGKVGVSLTIGHGWGPVVVHTRHVLCILSLHVQQVSYWINVNGEQHYPVCREIFQIASRES